MKILAEFKRDATFKRGCIYKYAGVASSISGMTLTGQIRNPYGNALVDSLVFTPLDQTAFLGQFSVTSLNADTSAWPLGNMLIDFKFNISGDKTYTDTFILPVVESITKDS